MTHRRLPSMHAIRAFEATARHLSMTRAAEELALTPGAVSRHVRGLQDDLGEQLLLRNSSGVTLTPAGETLAAAARDGLDRIAAAVTGLKLRQQRRLSIGAYGYFAQSVMLPHARELHRQAPDLALDLHTSLNPLDLSPAHYDAVVAVSDGARRPGLIVRPLIPIATMPVCAPYLMQGGVLDFRSVPLLHTRPRPDDWPRWLNHAGIRNVPSPDVGSSFESIGLTLQAASAGLGAAIAIQAMVQDALDTGELVPAHHIVRPTRRYFSLIYDHRLASDPTLRRFEDWLIAVSERVQTGAGSVPDQ